MKKKNQFITNQVQVKQFFHKGGCGDEKKTKHRWRHCCRITNEIRRQQISRSKLFWTGYKYIIDFIMTEKKIDDGRGLIYH